MNPLVVEALGSLLRAALNIGAGWLVAHGIWQQSDAEKYVGALALALASIAWSLWQHYRMRSKLVTAMAMPVGATEHEVERAVNDPMVRIPPVTLPKYATAVINQEPTQHGHE